MAYEPIAIRLGKYTRFSEESTSVSDSSIPTEKLIYVPSGFSLQPFSTCTNELVELLEYTPMPILDANPLRLYALFMNNSEVEITLSLGSINQIDFGRGILLRPGGSYEITQINLYRGPVSALAEAACDLSYVECVQ